VKSRRVSGWGKVLCMCGLIVVVLVLTGCAWWRVLHWTIPHSSRMVTLDACCVGHCRLELRAGTSSLRASPAGFLTRNGSRPTYGRNLWRGTWTVRTCWNGRILA